MASTSATVAVTIVNQNVVRTTVRRWVGVGRVEVEAEEALRDASPKHDQQHGRRRHEELDLPVVGRREIRRVQRQEKDAEKPGDEIAEPVDRRMPRQPGEVARQPSPAGFSSSLNRVDVEINPEPSPEERAAIEAAVAEVLDREPSRPQARGGAPGCPTPRTTTKSV